MSAKITNRILSLRLQRKRYDAEYTQKYIMYRGSKLDLTDEMFEELISLIPDYWNTEKDRLVQFVLFEDATFLCVRNKDVYNFSLKETEDKTYFFNAATKEQTSELVKILTDYFSKQRLQELDDFYNSIIDSLDDMSFMKQRILSMRQSALQSSDFMFNSDYTFKDIETQESWKEYRQQWRDITSSDAWINSDISQIKLPIAPKKIDTYSIILKEISNSMASVQVTDNLLEEMSLSLDCASYEKIADNFGEIYFKLEILKTLNKLKIPFSISLEEDLDSIENIENSLSSMNILPIDVYTRYKSIGEIEESSNPETMKSVLDQQLFSIDAKIQAINEKLLEYNFDYTITDILQKYAEDTKRKIEEQEKQEQAENLINELRFEGDEE